MNTPKEEARAGLATLLDEFQRVGSRGELGRQSEATARTWIEKLLGVLGWDPADPSQVRQEYRLEGRAARRLERAEISHRRPDYALLVDERPVLYLDAKRFSVNLAEDCSAAYQIRSYGWSVGFRLSYVCDFEELAIYDCRVLPKPDDSAKVARVLHLRCTEYLDRFDVVWNYLSREAVTNGSLALLHPDDELRRGTLPLDQEFEANLSEWRRELAKSILRHGHLRDPELLSAAAQRILDRIIFLRFCEEIGLEELGTLLDMAHHEDGFWPLFLEEHEKRYRRLYDGILFPRLDEKDATGVEEHLVTWWLKGRIFKDLVGALYNRPYRFDVMPIELLGGVYERSLGKRLRVVGNDVKDEFKPEYQRTKGAVYTPSWVVHRVVERTLKPLTDGIDPEALLELRVLDPACGSGSFLLGVFDHLERAILAFFRAHGEDPRRERFVHQGSDGARLTRWAVRAIIDRCLYGVDIDPEAVEVARMSLALRYLERTARDQEEEPHDLLKGVGRNVRHGNSLVGPDIVELGDDGAALAREALPFDWRSPLLGFGSILREGGFDAVVGNPPYIEVKRYREWMPAMYRYLKEAGVFETAAEGKTDISVPFMERAVSLLRPAGRLGFIVQNRFFKTDYGRLARRWLLAHQLVEAIEDFRDLQVFRGRTTYTAILVLSPGSKRIRYSAFRDLAAAEAGVRAVDVTLGQGELDEETWALDQPELLRLHRRLADRHGTIGSHSSLKVTVGLQTLFGKLYQLEPLELRKATVRARNGEGEEVTLERAALRPLCRNRGFYPFRKDNADAWVIFPYDVEGESFREIRLSDLRTRFPRTAAYLEERKRRLKAAVETEDGPQRWHLYKYPKNLVAQARPKVLFPSTIEDTMAAVDGAGDVYQDNVRINSIRDESGAVDPYALAAVFNSTAFSALARLKAGLSDGGWRQFNRQFAELVPLPYAALSTDGGAALAKLGRQVESLQPEYAAARGEGARQGLRATLASLWERLDTAVDELYGLSAADRLILAANPRLVDRTELVLRQTSAPEGEAA